MIIKAEDITEYAEIVENLGKQVLALLEEVKANE